jgi:transcriptional regulator with XRE-family HTH domain
MKRWRAQGKNQLDLAAATEIPDSTLSRIFNGHVQTLKPSHLARIALAMELDYESLMALAGVPFSSDPATADEAQDLELIRALPWARAAVGARCRGRALRFVIWRRSGRKVARRF